MKGWNLPTSNVVVEATGLDEGVVPIRASKLSGLCNAPPLALDTLPECVEHDANNSAGSAQAVKLPVIINGRIDRERLRFLQLRSRRG